MRPPSAISPLPARTLTLSRCALQNLGSTSNGTASGWLDDGSAQALAYTFVGAADAEPEALRIRMLLACVQRCSASDRANQDGGCESVCVRRPVLYPCPFDERARCTSGSAYACDLSFAVQPHAPGSYAQHVIVRASVWCLSASNGMRDQRGRG